MDGTFDKAEARAYLDNVKKHVSVEVDKVWPSIEEFILEGGGQIQQDEVRETTASSLLEFIQGPKAHHSVSLGNVMDSFVKLKDEPEIKRLDAEHPQEKLQDLEETVRKHFAKRIEGLLDTTKLDGRVASLHKAYASVLDKRCSQEGRLKKWLRVIREGNDSFRKVYDNVWEEVGKQINAFYILDLHNIAVVGDNPVSVRVALNVGFVGTKNSSSAQLTHMLFVGYLQQGARRD